MLVGTYIYENHACRPELNFIDIHGPDGFVSCATLVESLNCLQEVAMANNHVEGVYYLPHTNQWVVEANGRDIIHHNLLIAMRDAVTDEQEGE